MSGEMTHQDASGSDASYDSLLSVEVTQPLLKGFGRRITEAELDKAYHGSRREEMAFDLQAQSLLLEVVSAYYAVVRSDLLINVRVTAVEQAESWIEARIPGGENG